MEIIATTKITNRDGIKAIKNGQKANKYADIPTPKKPSWLKVKAEFNPNFHKVKEQVKSKQLYTVCEEAHCPNINECWSAGTATFMLMGSVCTRACKFCSVDTGNPKGKLDEDEPMKVANSIANMGLKYAVLTSVNRDDLSDGGAGHFSDTIRAIKEKAPKVIIEALVPDFLGDTKSLEILLDSNLEVFAQNLETVRRLTRRVRDPRAGYDQTLKVLNHAKQNSPKIITKTSLMFGLGETEEEILVAFEDIKRVGVDVLTLGQYMRPTINHLPVEKWYTPDEFEYFKKLAIEIGFLEVASGPMVRSSYRADRIAHLI